MILYLNRTVKSTPRHFARQTSCIKPIHSPHFGRKLPSWILIYSDRKPRNARVVLNVCGPNEGRLSIAKHILEKFEKPTKTPCI